MKRIPLIWQIVFAIALGVGLGFVLPTVAMRTLKTFNVLFAQILRFIVPLLILGLVTPAIADAGRGAGRLLVAVMAMSYVSTCLASFFGFACVTQLLPQKLLAEIPRQRRTCRRDIAAPHLRVGIFSRRHSAPYIVGFSVVKGLFLRMNRLLLPHLMK